MAEQVARQTERGNTERSTGRGVAREAGGRQRARGGRCGPGCRYSGSSASCASGGRRGHDERWGTSREQTCGGWGGGLDERRRGGRLAVAVVRARTEAQSGSRAAVGCRGRVRAGAASRGTSQAQVRPKHGVAGDVLLRAWRGRRGGKGRPRASPAFQGYGCRGSGKPLGRRTGTTCRNGR